MAEYPVLTELLNLSNVKVVHYQLVGQYRINHLWSRRSRWLFAQTVGMRVKRCMMLANRR